ncbi:MAG: M36 family metallopeptidase [candidate division NC10 bacterium]|nr:M36 family metallopeptidase [candidate division NC10 bacterium]
MWRLLAKRRRGPLHRVLVFIALIVLAPSIAWAQGVDRVRVTAGGGLPNFDARLGKEGHAVRQALTIPSVAPERKAQVEKGMSAAHQALAASLPGLAVEWHPVLGGPEVITARGRFLTPAAPGTEPELVVRSFLTAKAPLFGLSPSDVGNLVTTANYTNPAGNLRWVTLEQRLNGIPVFGGELRAAVTPDGQVATIASELAAGLDPALPSTPTTPPERAIQIAAQNIGVRLAAAPPLIERSSDGLKHRFTRGPFADDITVDLVIFPLGPTKAVLAWRVLLWQHTAAYYVIVDDVSGQVLWRKNITNDQSQTATYEVYPSDSPGPLSPSNATPGSGIQGPATSRSQFTFVSELPTFDNLGWIPDGSNVTTGNNVDAGLDIDGTDGIDPTGRATGVCAGPSLSCRNFIFTYNPPPGGSDPPTGAGYRNGIVADLFFWSNRYHDQLYSLGFTESARNFQNDNFGRGGLGGDRVQAEAQDSSGTNNANFSTPSDGTPGVMQMYIFTGPTPDRDGDIDHEVVLHELTHGLSNRLIGNGSGLTNQQGGGMGEGWSDFYALSLLSESGDNPNGVYAAGAYATLNFGGASFTDNYFYGIRRFPYTTSMGLNPMTFADIDPTQINTDDGTYPRSPIIGNTANEVHNVGQIWASMLWEARANIIARLGGTAGNNRMLQVVTDGMKLTPNAPTFTQARNAIIQADCAGFSGADEIDLWRGFAKRGLGFSAVAPASSSDTLTGVVEAFDLPLLSGTAVLSDTAGGNGNGVIDPGETIALTIPVSNKFSCKGLTSVTGTLSTTTTGVTITQASSNYGSLGAGATANGTAYQFTVAQSIPCGTLITFTLTLSSAEGASSTRTITARVGQEVTGTPTTFTYTGSPVPIPDNNPTGAVATLTVPGSLTVGDVNLNLTDITHTWIGDLVVQLIAPDGTNITMINRIDGGMNANDNFTNTVLDDEAANPIQSQTGPVTNASFRPANPLSGFDNKAGNGTWTLKIIDEAALDTGTITAWSLTITPNTFTCTSGQQFTLTVTTRGSGLGTVTSAPTGISCTVPGTCTTNFTSGTAVTLTASPGVGATFKQWGGACSGTATTCSLTLTANQSVTATFSQLFTDPTLTARSTLLKAVHVTELRSAINTLRAVNSLAAFAWTDATLTVGTTPAKKVHLDELRTALTQAYQAAGQPAPNYTDPTLVAGQTPIKAIHIRELRNVVRALE